MKSPVSLLARRYTQLAGRLRGPVSALARKALAANRRGVARALHGARVASSSTSPKRGLNSPDRGVARTLHDVRVASSGASPKLDPNSPVGVLPDVEGDHNFLLQLLQRFEQQGVSQFVCIGDLVGRGRDHRVLKTMLRDPRVKVRLAGNRDIMHPDRMSILSRKLQSRSSLIETLLDENPGKPFHGSLSPAQFACMHFGISPHQLTKTLQRHSNAELTVALTRFMLEEQMGSRGSFEARQEELAEEQGCSVYDIADMTVAESFISDAVHKGGLVRQYVEQSKLVHVDPSGVLAVHGAVPSSAILGWIPSLELDGSMRRVTGVPSLQSWADGWNEWHERVVEAALAGTLPEANTYHPAFTDILIGNPHSCVTGNWFNPFTGRIERLNPSVAQFLIANGIHTVFTGHQPVPFPFAIKHHISDSTDLIAVDGDTTYSGGEDRGGRASTVVLQPDGEVEISSFKDNALRHHTSIKRHNECLIGRVTIDNRLVVSKGGKEDTYVLVTRTGGKRPTVNKEVLHVSEFEHLLYRDASKKRRLTAHY